MEKQCFEYVHKIPDEEVLAIGGHYRFTDEVIVRVDSVRILYLRGYAIFDSTCCGAGGCSYALVQGIVEQWKVDRNSQGNFVSRIRPVESREFKEKITRIISQSDTMVQQVQFK